MERPLLPDSLPADMKAGDRVQLVYDAAGGSPTLHEPVGIGWLASPGSLVSRTRAQQEFADAFPEADRPMALFAATFLRVNCLVETSPTPASPSQRAKALVVARRYEAGEAILKRGQVVDLPALGALAQIPEKVVIGKLQQQVAAAETVAGVVGRHNWWLLGLVLQTSVQ
jgi:hypothetical protein